MHDELYSGLAPAKPTIYDGQAYRSRSEAKWAIVLTKLGLPFYYEPSSYRLASGLYLPDFWLPSLSAYLEVKPEDTEDPRYGELGALKGTRVFLVASDIPYVPFDRSERSVYGHLLGHIWLKWPEEYPGQQSYMLAREARGRINIVPVFLSSTAKGNDPEILAAYLAASSHSFESPECPS